MLRLSGSASGALSEYTAATDRFSHGMVLWVRRIATPAAIAVGLLQAAASFAIAYAVGAEWDASRLAAVVLLSLALVAPALRLGHGLDYVSAGRAAVDRIEELLRERPIGAGACPAPTTAVEVDIDHAGVVVEGRAVLDTISFRAPPRSVTVVTGESGAGKSTLLRSIAGLQPLTTGAVRLGGVPVESIREDARPHAALLVPQGGDVLDGTVRRTCSSSRPPMTRIFGVPSIRSGSWCRSMPRLPHSPAGATADRVGSCPPRPRAGDSPG